jgi:hypothetical protein
MSAAAIVLCAYYGQRIYQSLIGGLFSGLFLAALIIAFICRYAYRNSELNRIYRE